jgi:hypothetical protein
VALLLAVPVGLLCGGSSALFLWLLDRVTQTRLAHEWLVYLLPLAGALLGVVWERYAGAAAGGFGTILDRLHDGGPPVPRRMAPLVLGGTLVTHLFGGSAGREGTAVQMGGSLADTLLHRLGLASDAALRSTVLACGIAAASARSSARRSPGPSSAWKRSRSTGRACRRFRPRWWRPWWATTLAGGSGSSTRPIRASTRPRSSAAAPATSRGPASSGPPSGAGSSSRRPSRAWRWRSSS